jgi:hypothetical protein
MSTRAHQHYALIRTCWGCATWDLLVVEHEKKQWAADWIVDVVGAGEAAA